MMVRWKEKLIFIIRRLYNEFIYLFGDNLSINIEIVFGRGLHSENKRPILKYVILRQAEKYKYFGYEYKLNKKTANGSMIITF